MFPIPAPGQLAVKKTGFVIVDLNHREEEIPTSESQHPIILGNLCLCRDQDRVFVSPMFEVIALLLSHTSAVRTGPRAWAAENKPAVPVVVINKIVLGVAVIIDDGVFEQTVEGLSIFGIGNETTPFLVVDGKNLIASPSSPVSEVLT